MGEHKIPREPTDMVQVRAERDAKRVAEKTGGPVKLAPKEIKSGRPEGACCGNCKFVAEQPIAPDLTRSFVCEWGPPSVTVIPAPGGRGLMRLTAFPQPNAEHWCHRHEPRPEATAIALD